MRVEVEESGEEGWADDTFAQLGLEVEHGDDVCFVRLDGKPFGRARFVDGLDSYAELFGASEIVASTPGDLARQLLASGAQVELAKGFFRSLLSRGFDAVEAEEGSIILTRGDTTVRFDSAGLVVADGGGEKEFAPTSTGVAQAMASVEVGASVPELLRGMGFEVESVDDVGAGSYNVLWNGRLFGYADVGEEADMHGAKTLVTLFGMPVFAGDEAGAGAFLEQHERHAALAKGLFSALVDAGFDDNPEAEMVFSLHEESSGVEVWVSEEEGVAGAVICVLPPSVEEDDEPFTFPLTARGYAEAAARALSY